MHEQGQAAKLLVAEASESLRRRIIRILCWDFQVIGAVSNGVDLVRAAESLQPDAIVSSMFLPARPSAEVRSELQTRGREIPFVFLSSESDIREYLVGGPAAYVHIADLPTNLNVAVRSALAGQPYLSERYRK